ncbi:HPF/RaiA family ribosome-associated protein [Phenylobacterium kunshanense]|uniref:HPF/RaiA family ribosome-associated protein n=1 Tax=Phenylobacterium kunshanense TaxID=1445034 RepID=A0A328BJM9_9CAUL|nr:HPF/RaiA family ribosome-associated protein [Phenylobacterium kunshanense]RAK67187.1 hypothetical protein DJ019_04410 [Phenylobacterium kunshanense]
MPEKHPNTVRWGGPGASHEDASKPMSPSPEGAIAADKSDLADAEAAGHQGFEATPPERAAADQPSGPPGSERGVQVLVNTDNHLPGNVAVASRVEAAVRQGLRRFESHITHVEVFLADENAAKSGPGDKRCSIEARPRGADPLAASDRGASIDEAVTSALGKLARVLDKELSKRRDHKGGETVRGAFPG